MYGTDTPRTYQAIFDARAARYHAAMAGWPRARDEEFAAVVPWLKLAPGQRLADLPCGGGYLSGHLPDGVDVIGVDPSASFAALGQAHAPHPVTHAPLTPSPVPAGSVDAVVSVAGLHHAPNLDEIFEAFRDAVRPGGRVVVADVERGTGPAVFLNGFVDAHNPQGHDGDFFHEGTAERLRGAGLEVEHDAVAEYRWRYPDDAGMAAFLRDLFGIEATDEAVLEAVARDLGMEDAEHEVSHGWSLRVIACRRPTTVG